MMKRISSISVEIVTQKSKYKDSVFSYLFKDEQYRYQLYKFLHPEDTTVQPKDIAVNTLAPVMVNDLYNDLCLRVRDRMMIFVEDQSTFGQNLAFRIFLYAASTYREYALKHEVDIYHGSFVFPEAEFYVVYTGDRKVPGVIKLSNSIKGIELKVKVLKGRHSSGNNIVYQYVEFCRIAKEKRLLYPDNGHRAIVETIAECIKKNILAEFLDKKQVEVINIMDTLFSQEVITRNWENRIRKESLAEGRAEGRTEGRAEGRVEGRAEGKAEEKLDIAQNLIRLGQLSLEMIAEATGLTVGELKKLKVGLKPS